MAPSRKKQDNHQNNQGGQQPQRNRNNHGQPNNGMAIRPIKCVRPAGCLEPERMIYKLDIDIGDIEVVRVTCNNVHCDQGNFMHLECFNEWEGTVLNFLSSTGRARSWSAKQRSQNLWTKKGYDLAFKACDCQCGKGHLRKDLDWVSPKERMNRARNPAPAPRNEAAAAAAIPGNNQPPQQQAQENREVAQNNNNPPQADGGKKKKKSKAKENLPTLSLSAPVPHPNDNHSRKVASNVNASSSTACNAESVQAPMINPWGYMASAVPDSVLDRPRLNSL
jgi:hypothetical protein